LGIFKDLDRKVIDELAKRREESKSHRSIIKKENQYQKFSEIDRFQQNFIDKLQKLKVTYKKKKNLGEVMKRRISS